MGKVTRELIPKLLADYEAKITWNELARKYNTSKPTIKKILEQNGIKFKRLNILRDREQEVIEKYKNLRSSIKVAAKFNVDRTVVLKILKKYGVVLVDPHERNTTEKMDEKIANEYEKDKLSSIQLGCKYGISSSTITKILGRQGVKTRKCGRQKILSEKAELEMVEKYDQNNSLLDLGRIYNVSFWTARDALLRHNVTMRPAKTPRKYKLDETVFDKITEESAYWTGVMISDGNIKKNNSVIRLCLKKSDRRHIEKFRDFLGSTHPIWYRRKKYGIEISSKNLAKALNKFGVAPGKTFKAKVVDLENDRHFWRGECDGDGCISISKTGYIRLELCGSYQLMCQFYKYAKKVCPKNRAAVRRLKRIYRLSLNGKAAVAMICHLYKDCNVALDRKLKKAKHIIKKKERLGALFSSL